MEDINRTFASEHSESHESPDSQDLRIVLLGVCGAGKSATANAILGREAFKESGTRESEIQRGRVEDRNISIIDTPGFFNTQMTDEELQEQMMKSLYLSRPGPHVFLLIINPETFREEQRSIVEQIQKIFGAQAMKFTMVLFTGREKWIEFIESENIKELLNYFARRFHVINSKDECDPYQITMLFKIIDEMVKKNGGQNYSNEIYLKNEEIKQEVKKKQENEELLEQKREINPEGEIKYECEEDRMKTDNERKQEDVSEDKHMREKHAADQEHLRKQTESQEEMKKLIQEIARESWHSNKDLRIVLLGKTGSGKSSAGNTIIRNFTFKSGMSSKSITSHCQRQLTTVEDRNISVIDTPGLFDTSMSEEQLKAEIVRCVYMSAPGPHVFLLVMGLGMRYTKEEKNTVKWIQENFGEEATRYTIILFTRGDQLEGNTLDDYISENNDLMALVNECGGRFHSFNNKDMENRSQVTELLEKIKKIVKKNGGQHYTNEMYRKAQKEIEWEAWKQTAKDYGKTLLLVGGGAVLGGAGVAVAGESAVAVAGRAATAVAGVVIGRFRL